MQTRAVSATRAAAQWPATDLSLQHGGNRPARLRRKLTRIQSIGAQKHTQPGPARTFARADLESGDARRLRAGRWANAVIVLFDHDGARWAVKDFRPRSWLVRNVIGRFLVRREVYGLRRLQGVPGTPQDAFRLDSFALAYRFIPGQGLRGLPKEQVPRDFFPRLERNVIEMHAQARLVHLDLRNADNILVTASGEPCIIDLQSHVRLRWLPGPLRRFAVRVDLASVYKHWAKLSPETLGPERKAMLDRINELRPLWALRGYLGAPHRDHDTS